MLSSRIAAQMLQHHSNSCHKEVATIAQQKGVDLPMVKNMFFPCFSEVEFTSLDYGIWRNADKVFFTSKIIQKCGPCWFFLLDEFSHQILLQLILRHSFIMLLPKGSITGNFTTPRCFCLALPETSNATRRASNKSCEESRFWAVAGGNLRQTKKKGGGKIHQENSGYI